MGQVPADTPYGRPTWKLASGDLITQLEEAQATPTPSWTWRRTAAWFWRPQPPPRDVLCLPRVLAPARDSLLAEGRGGAGTELAVAPGCRCSPAGTSAGHQATALTQKEPVARLGKKEDISHSTPPPPAPLGPSDPGPAS